MTGVDPRVAQEQRIRALEAEVARLRARVDRELRRLDRDALQVWAALRVDGVAIVGLALALIALLAVVITTN